jgi:hypothetical protein
LKKHQSDCKFNEDSKKANNNKVEQINIDSLKAPQSQESNDFEDEAILDILPQRNVQSSNLNNGYNCFSQIQD